MKRLFLLSVIGFFYLWAFSQETFLPPDKIYGQLLFRDVQLKAIFPDSKTFVDCIPKITPEEITKSYSLIPRDSISKIRLERFVHKYFIMPSTPDLVFQNGKPGKVEDHINLLWNVLERKPDQHSSGSSLLPLPFSYIVPGGRFREIYYWDSYFTMLGLQQSGHWDIIENMIRNFSFLIQTYGHIPNGNRTYYLSRSQPPFFSLMVGILAEEKGNIVYSEYLNSLRKEYDYWMDNSAPTKHVVHMPDGSVLNRYFDQDSIPRQESYREDYELAHKESLKANKKNQAEKFSMLCRNLRSAAESGWDFSSRWFDDGRNVSTIQTTSIIPVDLNCLVYHLESTLARAYQEAGNTVQSELFLQKAKDRKEGITKYCWNEKGKWFVDS